MRPIIVVHGGAGSWRVDSTLLDSIKAALENALLSGFRLSYSGSALDMVVESVKVLEDSGIFNAGTGSTVDLSGNASMDAGIMFEHRAGAVAYVRYPRNPIVLAKHVYSYTNHILIAGSAADDLARRLGLEPHPGPSERWVALYKDYIERIRRGERIPTHFSRSLSLWMNIGDTVGAVALDGNGRLAAAVSTGGIFLKFPGRVGDSPIPGAGFYANECGAAAATGVGEYIILSHLTLKVVEGICRGKDVAKASKEALDALTSRFGSKTAGIIAIDSSGRLYAAYNTEAMPWGYIDGSGKIALGGLPNPI
ncbi:MAG: isoaspartyl peptidase/L-asparaginase [Ignisphaera sp.]|nr:isoaspartyl peptidase/L-asparaginase [Ignisphaera sp.]MCX8167943.1 isoaspartyl peptidase/L-asparaginase [Ignisphaera sp.]MDW8085540.1 isoaspartyl peptidase/L-asparaginase [Ignisphaera sp.]